MAKLSAAAWVLHDVGLATAIGGTLFGREALQPAIHEIKDPAVRGKVADIAWRRFSWMNLAGHVAVAATWFFGRSMLSGREVSKTSRNLTLAKDALVIASLATGITSMILGRVLGSRMTNHEQTATTSAAEQRPDERKLQRAVGAVGLANLAANIGVAGVTGVLSMEASESPKFSIVSRFLP
ncbi:MAG: hypothetical protein JWO36_6114 [Myxococcales bacterium]|nr:hypothetical protein [Myxococcales bacterium]